VVTGEVVLIWAPGRQGRRGVAALVKQGTALLVVCGSIDDKAAQLFLRRYPTRRW